MSATKGFFEEIDRRWRPLTTPRIPLRIIGSGALMLQARYQRGTKDSDDIEAMIDDGLVAHVRLLERFRDAVDSFSGDARAEDLPTYVANLHRVERDVFGVDETEIELPSWI